MLIGDSIWVRFMVGLILGVFMQDLNMVELISCVSPQLLSLVWQWAEDIHGEVLESNPLFGIFFNLLGIFKEKNPNVRVHSKKIQTFPPLEKFQDTSLARGPKDEIDEGKLTIEIDQLSVEVQFSKILWSKLQSLVYMPNYVK